ncbi:lens fiber membrane intrinsic protein-like [Ambystoma mexicanum]|uniref:lens fiber membrane intrinsic protein-like n=1 Tax=Ambystoma mexicanum TaxID=8296 RepID=UPI0037E7C798
MLALQVSSLVLLLLSAIVNVISLATDFWIAASGSHFGLWRVCILDICGTLGNGADIDATRAFSIISLLLLLVAVLMQILEIMFNTVLSGTNKQKLTAILSFCAGASALIAMSVFTGSARPSGSTTYSWSFALGWVSTGLSLVAGAAAFLAFKHNPQ